MTQARSPGESATDHLVEQLFEEHRHELVAYCARRIGWSEAEDVTSEIFSVATRRRNEIRPESARAWLYGVARGLLSNAKRAESRRLRIFRRMANLGGATVELVDEVVIRRAEDAIAIRALERLRPNDQEILRLSAWEELSTPEIAIAMDISRSAAEQRLHRAKRRYAGALAVETRTGNVHGEVTR